MRRIIDKEVDILSEGITPEGIHFVEYFASDGSRWIMYGECNGCGECEIQNQINLDPCIVFTGVEIGKPGACFNIEGDNRKDVPCRPELKNDCQNCTLWGTYL